MFKTIRNFGKYKLVTETNLCPPFGISADIGKYLW